MKTRTVTTELVERGTKTGDATFHIRRLEDESLVCGVTLRTSTGDEHVTFPVPQSVVDEAETLVAKLYARALNKLGYA